MSYVLVVGRCVDADCPAACGVHVTSCVGGHQRGAAHTRHHEPAVAAATAAVGAVGAVGDIQPRGDVLQIEIIQYELSVPVIGVLSIGEVYKCAQDAQYAGRLPLDAKPGHVFCNRLNQKYIS